MAGIQVISTSTIQAPSQVNGDSTWKIQLTPWDFGTLPIEMNQKGLLFHKPLNAKDIQNQIQHLKQSLSTTLAFFPPLAGRLVIIEHQDNTASSFIECNNLGALFVHAIAENTCVADILQPKYVPPIVHSFFSLRGVRNYQGTSHPLLAVQVTELVDGIFIGFTINHVVVDGQSFWHFINSWAEISRGFDKISKVPSRERWFPNGVDIPMYFPFSKEEKQHSKDSKFNPPATRIFHFTKEKISQLKSKANSEANTNKISSLQALLTHLWLYVIRHQHVDPQEEIRYSMAIGVRSRIVPPLPENYFGNAMQTGTVTMKAGELLEGGLGKGALEMNKMVASHSDEKVRSHYEYKARTPILLQVGGLSSKALITGSSPRFDVYGNDFGWGKPVAVRAGGSCVKTEGIITLFGGPDEVSVDIQVCLPYELLEAIGNDPEFLDDISV